MGTIGAIGNINYATLGPVLPQETVDRLEHDCINIVKVKRGQSSQKHKLEFVQRCAEIPQWAST